jgi:hypothetical protein
LHSKNLTARGVNANFFGVFRSGLRNINGPEAPFPVRPFLVLAGPPWEASTVLSPHANDTKTSGLPWLGISDRAEIMAAWLDRGSCRDRFRLRRVSRLFPPQLAPMPCCDIKSFFN